MGLCMAVLVATQIGSPATALFAVGLPTMLVAVVLLETARRR